MSGSVLEGMYSLRLGAIWRFFTQQRLSFWLVCLYMLFEYVRPQAIYTWLEPIPWSEILILGAPLAFLLEGGRVGSKDPISLWMILFSIAVLLSWALAQYPAASQEKMFIWVNWVLVYVLVANIANTEGKFFVFYLLFLLASFKMSQFGARVWASRGFGFASWGATGAPGWFHNSGEFGIQMCIFFPLTLYFISGLRSHWSKTKRILLLAAPITAVMSMVATNSRGALIGGAAVGLWILLRTRYRVRALVGLAVVVFLVVKVMPPESRKRYSTMGEDNTSQNRLTFWRHGIETFKRYPVTGIGYENWGDYYRNYYGRIALPHNIFIQAGAELGSIGLVSLLGLIVSSFVVNWRTRKLAAKMGDRGRFLSATARGLDGAMIGYLASAFFITVLYYPYLWFSLGLTSALYGAAQVGATSAGSLATASQPPAFVPVAGWRTAASGVARQSQRILLPPRSSRGR